MRTYIRTDRNGTKIYHDNTCQRCGGQGGADQWIFTGRTCYECGGSGVSKVREFKEYTPEYRAKLDAKNKINAEKKQAEYVAEKIATASARNQEFLNKKFFGGVDTIAVVKGETYSIKDELKAEGCIFQNGIGWYCQSTTRDAHIVAVSDITQEDTYGTLGMKDVGELMDIMKAIEKQSKPVSAFQGEVGDKVAIELEVVKVISFEVASFRGYGTDTMYITKMLDTQGNVYIWKSGKHLDGKGIVKGTIKAHEEYDDCNQTVLTRCKML